MRFTIKKKKKKKWYQNSNHRKFTYPNDVDKELVPMLDVFNNIPGVRTEYSCSGHDGNTWYITFKCSSEFVKNVILNYFTDTPKLDDDDPLNRLRTNLEYEVVYDEHQDSYNIVPEKNIAIYCKELGEMTEKKRMNEYKKICEFFSKLTPHYGWERVHEFDY